MGGLCGSTKTAKPDWNDPLGPNAGGTMGPTGGPEARAKIFEQIDSQLLPQANKDAAWAANATRSGYDNPVWGSSLGYLTGATGGKYLNGSPYLDRAISAGRRSLDENLAASRSNLNSRLSSSRGRAEAGLRGTQAGNRSMFARTGQAFGTTNQQAADATQAALQAELQRSENEAATAQAGQEATSKAALEAANTGKMADVYQQERGLQQQAATAAPGVASARTQLAQSLPALNYAGVKPAADIVQQLAGNGAVTPATMYRTPGAFDYAMQVGGLAGMAGY